MCLDLKIVTFHNKAETSVSNQYNSKSVFRGVKKKKKMNVFEDEPVLEPRYVPEHDSPFDYIDKKTTRDLEARNGHNSNREIPVIRAALADYNDDHDDDIFPERNGKQENPRKKSDGQARDLRSLIDQMKLQQSYDTETRSDDSFYSAEAEMTSSKGTSLSYVRDLINALGSQNSSDSKRQEIMNTLINLDLSVQLAEPLTCSGYDDRLDIFQVCSIMLLENGWVLLGRYLKFFGNVLEMTFQQPDLPYGLKKLIHKRVDEFELYQRLVEILDQETKKEDLEFLNVVAKVVYFATSKPKVADLNRAQEFSLRRFIKKLHDKKVKYLNKLSIKYIQYLYEIRHEQLNMSSEAYVDLEYYVDPNIIIIFSVSNAQWNSNDYMKREHSLVKPYCCMKAQCFQ